jgi:hypothetical protein
MITECPQEVRDAILARDALIERIRAGEDGLIEEMHAACEYVEELARKYFREG